MPRKEKLGGRGGVAQWKPLETAGDVKRFLRWVILSLREQSLSRADAAVFSQLALAMLKAVETADLEARMARLEHALDADAPPPRHPPTTH